jgi:hypothetical protein
MVEPPSNPNRMPEAVFQRLRKAIGREGFNAAILARELGGGLVEIIDGCHRVQAARDLGIQEIPAWVYPEGACDDAKAKALQIGYNAMVGEPDLTAVARAMEEFSLVDLGLVELAGYSALDADALIAALQPISLDDLASDPEPAGPADPEDKPAPTGKPVQLVIDLASKAELKAVKAALRKAGGGSKDLADGLRALVGCE